MDKRLENHAVYKERAKRKEQRKNREANKEKASLRASLMTDLTDALSKKGITIKNAIDIVDDLITKGWLKKEFEKRKWN